MRLWCVAVVLVAALTAAAPPAPFDLSDLHLGEPVPSSVPRTDGRPLVIYVFSSWCKPCVDKMSEVIGDYRHFGDRVDFLAVDFLDTQAGLESVTNNFNVPFAVVRAMPQGTDDGQTASAGATTAPPSSAPLPIYIKGMTPEQFPRMVGFLAAAPMGSDAIKEINSYCSAHSAMECTQYAEAHGVVFGAAPSGTGAPALPHLFVIDAHGIVRSDVGGFKVGRDDIPFELAKIGIR